MYETWPSIPLRWSYLSLWYSLIVITIVSCMINYFIIKQEAHEEQGYQLSLVLPLSMTKQETSAFGAKLLQLSYIDEVDLVRSSDLFGDLFNDINLQLPDTIICAYNSKEFSDEIFILWLKQHYPDIVLLNVALLSSIRDNQIDFKLQESILLFGLISMFLLVVQSVLLIANKTYSNIISTYYIVMQLGAHRYQAIQKLHMRYIIIFATLVFVCVMIGLYMSGFIANISLLTNGEYIGKIDTLWQISLSISTIVISFMIWLLISAIFSLRILWNALAL